SFPTRRSSDLKAMSMCIERAKNTGAAFASVTRVNHYGACAFYSMMALKENMIGLTMCNTDPLMAVHGGTSRVLGTNPLSVAVPAAKHYPIVLDFASS